MTKSISALVCSLQFGSFVFAALLISMALASQTRAAQIIELPEPLPGCEMTMTCPVELGAIAVDGITGWTKTFLWLCQANVACNANTNEASLSDVIVVGTLGGTVTFQSDQKETGNFGTPQPNQNNLFHPEDGMVWQTPTISAMDAHVARHLQLLIFSDAETQPFCADGRTLCSDTMQIKDVDSGQLLDLTVGVPEPSTLVLMSAGILGFLAYYRIGRRILANFVRDRLRSNLVWND